MAPNVRGNIPGGATLGLTPRSEQDPRDGQAASRAGVSARTAEDAQVRGRLLPGRRGQHRASARTALWALPRDAALHASTKEPPQEDVPQDAAGKSRCLVWDWGKTGTLHAQSLAPKE